VSWFGKIAMTHGMTYCFSVVYDKSHFAVPAASLLFFVLPQRKVTKENGIFSNSSARKKSYTAPSWSLICLRLSPTCRQCDSGYF
jgi:hypothetical protein